MGASERGEQEAGTSLNAAHSQGVQYGTGNVQYNLFSDPQLRRLTSQALGVLGLAIVLWLAEIIATEITHNAAPTAEPYNREAHP